MEPDANAIHNAESGRRCEIGRGGSGLGEGPLSDFSSSLGLPDIEGPHFSLAVEHSWGLEDCEGGCIKLGELVGLTHGARPAVMAAMLVCCFLKAKEWSET